MFCLTQINNAILTSTKAMPLKDLTSDNNSTFSMARKQYIRVLGEDTNFNVNTNIQKKWYGNSSIRDSTKVIAKKIRNNVGNGSLNYSNNNFAFVDTNHINTRFQALKRVRNSGFITPPIKTHSFSYKHIFF
jgi:hypothetical protein